jgi:hypothetical protein
MRTLLARMLAALGVKAALPNAEADAVTTERRRLCLVAKMHARRRAPRVVTHVIRAAIRLVYVWVIASTWHGVVCEHHVATQENNRHQEYRRG